jgi:hypothetical protein
MEKSKTLFWASFWDKVDWDIYTNVYIEKRENSSINFNRKKLSQFFRLRSNINLKKD